LPVTQVNAVKDKGRANMIIFLIFVTIVGCPSTVVFVKYHKNSVKSTFMEDIMRGHVQYSKARQEQPTTTFKER